MSSIAVRPSSSDASEARDLTVAQATALYTLPAAAILAYGGVAATLTPSDCVVRVCVCGPPCGG